MSEFDIGELERCWNCGKSLSDSMPARLEKPFTFRISRDRHSSYGFWLLLPWLVLVAFVTAVAFGMENWLANTLPYGLGTIAVKNSPLGLLVLWIGCAVRWAYLRATEYGYEKLEFLVRVIGYAALTLLVQALAPIVGIALLFILTRGVPFFD